MKSSIALIVVGIACVAVHGKVDKEDAAENILYGRFINTDVLHAACYFAFCECSKEPYSGRISPLHEKSCDSHRMGWAQKSVHECTETPKCMEQVARYEKGLFSPLITLIETRNIDDPQPCSFFLSTCYGMLLRDAVNKYDQVRSENSFLNNIKK